MIWRVGALEAGRRSWIVAREGDVFGHYFLEGGGRDVSDEIGGSLIPFGVFLGSGTRGRRCWIDFGRLVFV